MQGGREQQRLVHIRGAKALSHGRILTPYTLWKSCYVWCFCRIYSRQTPSGRVSAQPWRVVGQLLVLCSLLSELSKRSKRGFLTCCRAPVFRYRLFYAWHKR